MIAQQEVEMAETKARWQNEAAQKTAEYHDHLKRIESRLNQVPFNQVIQEQRSQRDLEIQAEELRAKNKILEKRLAAQKESEEELRIAKERLSSKTIHIPDGEDDIEQLFQASSEEVNLVDMPPKVEAVDFNPTPREIAQTASVPVVQDGTLQFSIAGQRMHTSED